MGSSSNNRKRFSSAGDGDLRHILGENVHSLRIEQNLSKKTFSHMTRVSRPLLDRIERGEADIRMSYVIRLADGLSTSPIELLSSPMQNERRLEETPKPPRSIF